MNFDINKIKKIPKCPIYDNKAKEKWIEYLGDAVYIDKPTRDEKYILVEALNTYNDFNLKDSDLGYIPKEKERWLISERRLEILLGDNDYNKPFVKIVNDNEKNNAEEEGNSI
jgi:hypothetical protein